MPLDVAVAPKTLTSTLHYLKRGAEKPARYRTDPPPGVPRWNGEDDMREVTIEDARGRETEFTLDRNGFQIVKAPTAVADFYDPDEIKRVYYPEVERLVKEKLGASRVVVFDHNVRNATKPGHPPPSRQVHNDHTVNSAPRRVRDHLPDEADELLKNRFGIVNVWRPIRGPVQDSPLALCDARSFTDDDLIARPPVGASSAEAGGRVEGADRGEGGVEALDLDPGELAGRTLRQRGCAGVGGQNIGVAVHAERPVGCRVALLRPKRIEPGAGR